MAAFFAADQGNNAVSGGSGSRLGQVAIILAGIASFAATVISLVSIWLQLKNYRKPLLQRHVVRILIMYTASEMDS